MECSVNKVMLLGRLGKDPVMKTFDNGARTVCSFSICTNQYKMKPGSEPEKKSEWHYISVNNAYLVNIAEKNLKKGSLVWVEGQLETRKYKSYGQDKTMLLVNASVLKPMLDPLRDKNDTNPPHDEDDNGFDGIW